MEPSVLFMVSRKRYVRDWPWLRHVATSKNAGSGAASGMSASSHRLRFTQAASSSCCALFKGVFVEGGSDEMDRQAFIQDVVNKTSALENVRKG